MRLGKTNNHSCLGMLVFILHSLLEIVHLSLIQELILNQRDQQQKHYDNHYNIHGVREAGPELGEFWMLLFMS